MKIYFAGSIRGGREDADTYREIVDLLKRKGDVLTEHVGRIEPEESEHGLSDELIYERDMAWLEEADLLVAEVTVPSHGVGYEIARSEVLKKPILCLYRSSDETHLSALIAGNPSIETQQYQHPEQLAPLLETFLQVRGVNTEA